MKKQNHTESNLNNPCQTYNSMFGERGHSMIEVLGTLTVAGILVVGGVKAYTHAMNQHRANELLNEANKRAVVLAAQIMAGRETLSIGEFKNTTSYGTFSAPSYKKGAKTFTLFLSDVEPNVCRSMKNFVDEDSVLAIEGECTQNVGLTLRFNTDLKKKVVAEDDDPQGNCAEEYDIRCQRCNPENDQVENRPYGVTCDYDGDGKNESTCYKGQCLSPTHIDHPCLDNSDCGDPDSGYYCYHNYTTKETMDTHEAMGCVGKNVLECDPDNYYFRRVTYCRPLPSKEEANIPGLGTVIRLVASGYFWGMRNACLAYGKDMIPVEKLQVYRSEPGDSGYDQYTSLYGKTLYTQGGGRQEAVFACAQGKTCGSWNSAPYNAMWDGNTLTDARDENGELYSSHFSPIVVALRQAFGGVTVYLRTDAGVDRNVLALNLKSGTIYPTLYSSYDAPLCN